MRPSLMRMKSKQLTIKLKLLSRKPKPRPRKRPNRRKKRRRRRLKKPNLVSLNLLLRSPLRSQNPQMQSSLRNPKSKRSQAKLKHLLTLKLLKSLRKNPRSKRMLTMIIHRNLALVLVLGSVITKRRKMTPRIRIYSTLPRTSSQRELKKR